MSAVDDGMRRAVLRRLAALDQAAEQTSTGTLPPLARAELQRLADGWRLLLEVHTADEDGRCRACPGRLRKRRWPCKVWLLAHQHLIGEGAPSPQPRSGWRNPFRRGGRHSKQADGTAVQGVRTRPLPPAARSVMAIPPEVPSEMTVELPALPPAPTYSAVEPPVAHRYAAAEPGYPAAEPPAASGYAAIELPITSGYAATEHPPGYAAIELPIMSGYAADPPAAPSYAEVEPPVTPGYAAAELPPPAIASSGPFATVRVVDDPTWPAPSEYADQPDAPALARLDPIAAFGGVLPAPPPAPEPELTAPLMVDVATPRFELLGEPDAETEEMRRVLEDYWQGSPATK